MFIILLILFHVFICNLLISHVIPTIFSLKKSVYKDIKCVTCIISVYKCVTSIMSLFGVSKINQQISMIGLANVLELKWIKSCQLTQFYWRDYFFLSCGLCYPHYPILLIPKITHTHKNFVIV